MTNAELTWRNARQRSRIAYDDATPVGVGGQAQVLNLLNVDGRPADEWLLKIYSDREEGTRRHAVQFAHYVASHDLQSKGLIGLPRQAFEFADGTGRVGYLMHRVPGRDMDSTTLYKWIRGQTLAKRLQVAWQIAESVARLHEAKVVHADINDSNLMLDQSTGTAYVIDVDGGGVLQDGVDDKFLPDLYPLVRGKPNTMAPELHPDPSRHPTRNCDDYSLAVMVHRLLLPFGAAGIHPFFCLKSSPETRRRDLKWPPDQADFPNFAKQIEAHRKLLNSLGQRLRSMCVTTFGVGRVDNPNLRVPAKEWARVLLVMSRWCHTCTVGHETVAYETHDCVFCGEQIRHARLELPGGATRILDQDLVLLSHHLGFHDGDYEVVGISREGTVVRVACKVQNGGHQSELVSSGSSRRLSFRSRDGRSKATLLVAV